MAYVPFYEIVNPSTLKSYGISHKQDFFCKGILLCDLLRPHSTDKPPYH